MFEKIFDIFKSNKVLLLKSDSLIKEKSLTQVVREIMEDDLFAVNDDCVLVAHVCAKHGIRTIDDLYKSECININSIIRTATKIRKERRKLNEKK